MKFLIICFLGILFLQQATSSTIAIDDESKLNLGIVNGDNAPLEFGNHTVTIIRISDILRQKKFHCTGSLIDPRTVVTAGHCAFYDNNELVKAKKVIIRYGSHKLENLKEVLVKSIIIHPKFEPSKNTRNDISIFKLQEPVRKQPGVSFIKLQKESLKYGYVEKPFSIYSFGAKDKEGKHFPKKLKREITSEVSEKVYREVFSQNNNIQRGTLLTRSKTSAVCKGDIGAGLSYKSKLIAVVSGIQPNLCKKGQVEVSAKVYLRENLKFIEGNMG